MTELPRGRTNIRVGCETVVCCVCKAEIKAEIKAQTGNADRFGAPEGWEARSLGCFLLQACPSCVASETWRNITHPPRDEEDVSCAGCGRVTRSASVVPAGWLYVEERGTDMEDYGDYWTVCSPACGVTLFQRWGEIRG